MYCCIPCFALSCCPQFEFWMIDEDEFNVQGMHVRTIDFELSK